MPAADRPVDVLRGLHNSLPFAHPDRVGVRRAVEVLTAHEDEHGVTFTPAPEGFAAEWEVVGYGGSAAYDNEADARAAANGGGVRVRFVTPWSEA